MNTQTTLLTLALISAFGASAAANAQDAKLNPKAKVDATIAAEQAVDDAHAAHTDANMAKQAAVAAKATEGTALTAEGAAIAAEAAIIANQAAIEARQGSHRAGNAANEALGAKSAAHVGNQPVGAVDEARQAARTAERAGFATADAAATASVAAAVAEDAAAMPPTPTLPPIATTPLEPDVTVMTVPRDSGDYSVDFEAMDLNRDGYISKEEAASNPTLSTAFGAVDTDGDGKLSRGELEGWTK